MTFRPSMTCRAEGCDERLAVYETAYGWKASCAPCNVRWTLLRGDQLNWVAEVLRGP